MAARAPEGGTASGPDAAAIDLLGYIPEDVRGSCEIGAPTEEDAGPRFALEAASISAYLECKSGTGDIDFTSFTRFTDRAAMDRVYDALAGVAGDVPRTSEEGQCPENTTWRFGETPAGRVACYFVTQNTTGQQVPEFATRIWTYDDALILGTANARPPATNASALYKWWDDEAGPLKNPEKVDGLASTSSARIRAAEKRLRSQIPREQREACVSIDIGDPQSSRQLFFRTRLFGKPHSHATSWRAPRR